MLARIRKSMLADGKILHSGEIVDISNWRNARTLISNRYVELVNESPVNVSEDSEEVPVVEKKPKATKPKTEK